MTTVLFVWERGSGLGHAAPLIGLANAMVEHRTGIRPVFAFRDTVYTRLLLDRHPWPVIPTPVLPGRPEGRSSEASYAQLLLSIGFNRPPELNAIAATWDDLFGQVKPDLVVAENSPFACLAARGRLPLLVTGTAFNVPPATVPLFPPFRRGIEPPAIQRRICDVCNQILQSREQPPLQHLPQLLAGDARAVFGLPHLDPYGPLRDDPLLGPYLGRLRPRPVPEDRSVYLYTRTEEDHCDDIVDVLLDLGLSVSAFVSGPDTVARALLRNRGATLYDRPRDLQQVLDSARLVISHGGAGLTSAALMVGRAHLMVPNHVESEVNAMRVENIGAGLVSLDFDRVTFRESIETMLEVRHFHERAMTVAEEVAALDLPEDPLAAAASRGMALL